jgi:hypothetical protein
MKIDHIPYNKALQLIAKSGVSLRYTLLLAINWSALL